MWINRRQDFWDILKALESGMKNLEVKAKFRISDAQLSGYRNRFLETVVRIKDNIVDPNQLHFPFYHDNWAGRQYFNPNNDRSFFKRWKR